MASVVVTAAGKNEEPVAEAAAASDESKPAADAKGEAKSE